MNAQGLLVTPSWNNLESRRHKLWLMAVDTPRRMPCLFLCLLNSPMCCLSMLILVCDINCCTWLSQITTKVIRNVLTTKWRNTNVMSMRELLGGGNKALNLASIPKTPWLNNWLITTQTFHCQVWLSQLAFCHKCCRLPFSNAFCYAFKCSQQW